MELDRLADADELKAIRQKREPLYGAHVDNHENIGAVWGGILTAAGWKGPNDEDGVQQLGIVPDVVELMCAGLKLVRAANPGAPFHADSYNDAVNYIQMAGETKEELEG